MNLMDSASASFELDNKPLVRRYVLGVGAVCFGFWFFDYVMRGWFGGEPNLGVSLRHTFIIAICLVFVVGFLLKDTFQKITIDEEGISVDEAGGGRTSMKWSEIVSAAVESKGIICRNAEGRSFVIQLKLRNPNGFIESLEGNAGTSHALVQAARRAFINDGQA